MGLMASKAAAKKAAPKKPEAGNVIERVGEELEARFFESAELATETTSAESNIALAALGAIEGPREAKQSTRPKAANARSRRARPKAR